MNSDTLSTARAQQILAAGGIATGALAALAPDAFHRVYGTGEIDDVARSMTRYFGNALAASSVLVGLADDDQRSSVLTTAAVFNATSAVISLLPAEGVPAGTRARAGLTSAAFAALAVYAARR